MLSHTALQRPVILSLTCVVVLAVAACSTSGSDGEDREAIARALPPGVAVDALLETADQAQIALFRDGALTFSDYERATMLLLGCLEEAAFVVVDGPRFNEETNDFDYLLEVPPGEREASLEAQLACTQRFHLFAKMAWSWQHAPPEAALNAAKETMGACLRDAGYDFVPQFPQASDYDRVRAAEGEEAFNDCRTRVGAEYGIPDWGG